MIDSNSELLDRLSHTLKSETRPAAIVFNCHITGLAVARSLGSRGVPVIGLDREPAGLGLHSRYTLIAGRCPYPMEDERGFIDLLLEIGHVLPRKAVLFPCLDEWVFAVARHRSELEKFFYFPFSELETINRILDKDLLYTKCEELGIPIPKTYYLARQDPIEVAAAIAYPCIVKPALQREFTNEFGEKVFRAETRDEFLDLCRRASRHPLLAQEIVGAGVDSFYSLCSFLNSRGEALGVFVGRKLEQYPPDFGTACLVDSRYVGSIVERGVEVLKQFSYHGISEVEFLYDHRDGQFKLLDINTRVWKWIGLPIRAGIDLPWLAYADAIGQNPDPAPRQLNGMRWVYLKDYVKLRMNQRAQDPALDLSQQDWMRLIAGESDPLGDIVDAVLSTEDPGPFARLMQGLFQEKPYYCAC
jgi:predicted ATP-grasp superfamily ATP-dependent carboligase